MEDVLAQYQLSHDARHPLICFDERPCFLIEDVGGILPLSPGQAKRYHYEYKKNGSCCVFLAFEPRTGVRYVEVRARRTAVDYADFMQTLLARHYPEAESIRLVQDNLNTHTPGSFYEVLPPLGSAAPRGRNVTPRSAGVGGPPQPRGQNRPLEILSRQSKGETAQTLLKCTEI